VVPHINIRSPPLRPGKFVVGEIKRLLQHYRHETDIATASRYVRSPRQSGKHLLAASISPLTLVV
jgi:hypothetical protein